MNEPVRTAQKESTRRAYRTVGRVLLLVVLVPLGIVAGWFVLAPSAESLAGRAAHGADSAALLELVELAVKQPAADARLRELLCRDAAALNALAELANCHESALLYLISHARTSPESMASLAELEISYPFALRVLESITPDKMLNLILHAETCANARFMLGVAYENGCHVPQDWELAARWYGLAWASQYAPARSYYARASYNAGLAAGSESDAARLYQAAADCGHAAAQCALGVCYASGAGVPADMKQALAWYKRAAAQGMSDAQFNLGWCYLHGEGVAPDSAAAAGWFRKAAEQGDDLAQYYLGRAYELGEGVPRDYAAAFQWYRLAVELGNDAAQCALGHCYAQGRGTAQNWGKAAYWYKLSAGQGRCEAQLALAYCYQHGLGVPEDASAARYWRNRANANLQPELKQS